MTPSARSLDHSRAPDRCANAARGVAAVQSRQDGASSTNVPPGNIPASKADRLLLLRHHRLLHLHLHPLHFRGDARGNEDVVGAVAVDAEAEAVEANAAEIAVVVASVVAVDAVAGAGAPMRKTARTSRMLAFELG